MLDDKEKILLKFLKANKEKRFNKLQLAKQVEFSMPTLLIILRGLEKTGEIFFEEIGGNKIARLSE